MTFVFLLFFPGGFAMPRGTLVFHSAQVFLKVGSHSRTWARSQSFCDAIFRFTSCYSCLKQRWSIGKDCFKSISMHGHWRCAPGDQSEVRVHIHAFLRHEYRLRVQTAMSIEVIWKSSSDVNVRWKSWAQGQMFEPGLVLRAVP